MIQKNDINDEHDLDPTANLFDAVGGNSEKWKKIIQKEENKEMIKNKEGTPLEENLDVVFENYNRCDCPIFLNPQTASFTDVAIHGNLRQRLQASTIEKHLRYARFMETHFIPVVIFDVWKHEKDALRRTFLMHQ